MLRDPNIFAYVALLASIPLTFWLFSRYRAPQACALTILGAVMFLPEHLEFDVPLLPPMDKVTIPALAAITAALIYDPARLMRAKPFSGADRIFLLLLVGNVFTVLTNDDPISSEAGFMEPLRLWDIVVMTVRDSLVVFVMFLLGRALFNTRRDLYMFTTIMAGCGVVYAFLGMIEMRLSPQLHNWIYGYHAAGFDQSYRMGGYRPTVFMTHGLHAARFMLGAVLCAVALVRANRSFMRLRAGQWTIFLIVMLVMWRSTGTWVLAAVTVPIAYFTSARMQVRIAALLGIFVLLYPVLRFEDQVPIDDVLEWAGNNIGEERAKSLEDRFAQEEVLLEKIRTRQLFGFGPGQRYNVYDKARNTIQTVDGEWLITFGTRGYWGFLCIFGLYLIPIWAIRKHLKQLRPDDALLVSCWSVLLATYTFDNIPNSTGSLPQFFIAGAVYGATTGLARQTAHENKIAREERRRKRDLSDRPANELTS